jgi:hypothetical protein
MQNEIVVESFIYQEGAFYILIVPSIQKEPITKAKTQLEVRRKAINILRKDYKEKIIELPCTINNVVEKYDIPKNSILFPLPIKVGKRVKKFKRFSSSMNGEILEKIEKYSKNKKMKKSDFFTLACLEYMKNHP